MRSPVLKWTKKQSENDDSSLATQMKSMHTTTEIINIVNI
jgi:hypothetical protein